ncbi:MAG: ribosome-associated translation inhibitor RaiA [Fimbriiglobus sp.]|nr:ribosome-associated translation inhibitor RaiA [Fimbriiglobus sp.]
MQIKVSARHGHLSEEHQAEITAKAEKLLHYFERLTMIEVTVDLAANGTGHPKAVEIRVDAEHKHDFVATAADPDLMAAVTACVKKMEQQVRHYKDKVQDHRANPSHGGPEGKKP